ncbi:MAG: hypothetical protein COU09_01595 [Candidatus Harrisonbacteria bacterium CG10_big_fil_rev_8_21_14_0_10_44_23]|uniref:Uncharacterized protein n=1 Tax=Candidatus Harrisonbacteria bacterium CG10_big_fil_rev_8_21_14_0_10_44_23 TaxID=1974585 RepID=A0A2H0UQ68_9BACT|nr:MAG: hypothetical protein COU09_01595 [Candidatus Harrisonbacteria bacterium CG10_big_fil_rev_8_21_14_0_10_44_23]
MFETNPETLEKEISDLEIKLEAKKKFLAESGQEARPEKEVFRDVFREHAGSPGSSVKVENFNTAAIAPTTSQKDDDQKEEDKTIEGLVQLAFDKGLTASVEKAKKLSDPYLEDRLHDVLVDEYYQKLLDSRKIIS